MSSKPNRRVAIVGAGFAGLAAAEAIAAAGVEVVVVEARERVGGRVWSERLVNGGLIERGAEFITDGYDVTVEIAGRLGIELDGMGIHYPDRDLVPGPGPEAAVLAQAAEAVAELASTEPKASALEVFRRAVESSAVRDVLETRLQSALAHPLVDLEASYAMHLPDLVKSAETRRMRGGNQRLASELAAILGDRVRLGCPVREVRSAGDGVRVLGDGVDISATACVVAVPVALLPGGIRFDPPIEAAAERAITSIPTSRAAKLAVPLATSSPARAVMSGPDRFWAWTTPCDEVGGRVAGAWAGAEPVLESLGVHVGAGEWIRHLRRLWPALDLEEDGAVLTVWEDDPWARGAYSVLPSVPDSRGSAASIGTETVVFAGEHTAEPEWTGTMEGALRSGLRAASDVLGLVDRPI
jgi:monoamine oxidase